MYFKPVFLILPKMIQISIKFTITGAIVAVAGGVHTYLFSLISARQTSRIRKAYLHAILRQDMAWLDKQKSADLEARLSVGMPKVQESMGLKLSDLIYQAFQGIFGLAISFWYCWKLTLVFIAMLPAVFGSVAFFAVMNMVWVLDMLFIFSLLTLCFFISPLLRTTKLCETRFINQLVWRLMRLLLSSVL